LVDLVAAERGDWSQGTLALLCDVWLRTDALTIAEAYSRCAFPEFWGAYDRGAGRQYPQLPSSKRKQKFPAAA
jgi:hypothetical protein